jgi:cystathionine gamma-synthase/methionine-gamma-lyase
VPRFSATSIRRTSVQLTGEQDSEFRDWAGEGVFRVSVGLENPAEIIADFEQALG